MKLFYVIFFVIFLGVIFEWMRRRKNKRAFINRDKHEIDAERDKFIVDNRIERQVFFDAIALISSRLHLNEAEQYLVSPSDAIGINIASELLIFRWLSMEGEIDWLLDDMFAEIKGTELEKHFLTLKFNTIGDVIMAYSKLAHKQQTALWGRSGDSPR